MRSAIAWFALALISGCARRNGRSVTPNAALAGVSFVVADPDVNVPLQGAQVRLISEHRDTLSRLTDAAGAVTFDDLTAGNYMVLVRRIGYIAVERVINLSTGCRRQANVHLRTHRCDLAPDCVDPRSTIDIQTCQPDA
jgi:hypothetical protein